MVREDLVNAVAWFAGLCGLFFAACLSRMPLGELVAPAPLLIIIALSAATAILNLVVTLAFRRKGVAREDQGKWVEARLPQKFGTRMSLMGLALGLGGVAAGIMMIIAVLTY